MNVIKVIVVVLKPAVLGKPNSKYYVRLVIDRGDPTQVEGGEREAGCGRVESTNLSKGGSAVCAVEERLGIVADRSLGRVAQRKICQPESADAELERLWITVSVILVGESKSPVGAWGGITGGDIQRAARDEAGIQGVLSDC